MYRRRRYDDERNSLMVPSTSGFSSQFVCRLFELFHRGDLLDETLRTVRGELAHDQIP